MRATCAAGRCPELHRQRDVTREKRPHASIAHNLEHPPHARDHALAILNLIKDSLLHVVNEERQAVRAAHLGERARNLQAMQPIHAEHRTDPRPWSVGSRCGRHGGTAAPVPEGEPSGIEIDAPALPQRREGAACRPGRRTPVAAVRGSTLGPDVRFAG